MKPGKRNCERLRQSAWRGQHCQTMSVHLHIYCWWGEKCVLVMPPFIKFLTLFLLSFHPFLLSFTFFTCVSFPLHIFCSFLFPSVSSHSAAHVPFIHSSVAADINHVTGFPLSLTASILSLLSYPEPFAIRHTITSHPHSLIPTDVFAENMCTELLEWIIWTNILRMFSSSSFVWVTISCLHYREALLAEMGVAIREDGGTLGVFSPKKVKPTCERYVFPMGGDGAHASYFHENSSYRSMLFLIYSLHHCLSTLYMFLSHTQLSHEGLLDEQFDCFPTKKVCLI